ncbi:MAG: VRR-NUC domain-containing protein [Balneola sp.]
MKLTQTQKDLLRNLICGGKIDSFSGNTISSLKRRGFIYKDSSLTKKGFLKSLELVSLDKQCSLLSLNLIGKEVSSLNSPELQAFKWFKSQGFIGAFCEGGAILTTLKALVLDKLTELNTFNSREDACIRFLETQFTILSDQKNELLTSILETSHSRFLNNFSEIINHKSIQEYYPGLSIEFAEHFGKRFDREVFFRIAEIFFQAPYDYRKGWPDLTLVNNEEVRFVEIKTTDKLHQSQIQIIDRFRPLIPAKFEILKLTKS